MQQIEASISDNFKKMTMRAIMSIVLFILVYLTLFSLAILLVVLSAVFGFFIIVTKPMFFTLMIGAGLLSMGILVFIFLVKFIFNKHKVDRSHLTEITRAEEPELFKLIEEIVAKVNTDFPKKVYLSADVNASVFYDSGFWSMFLPVQKNLQIGLGLMNATTTDEFKAILAHEFGHFSQKTMKVGSYVYTVNQIIYNMLNDNESYSELAQKWANVSSYLSIFVGIAIKIVQGIQEILGKVYKVVNINYMGLSREMEFHADEVAAYAVGSKPLISSLLRLELADSAYDSVIAVYDAKIAENKKAGNLFPHHQFAIQFLAQEQNLSINNNLPAVDLNHLNRFNKSKLNIANQWASHPSIEDRIAALQKLNVNNPIPSKEIAISLLVQKDVIQNKITEKLFAKVNFENGPSILEEDEFKNHFTENYKKNTFSNFFNNYYNYKNPPVIDTEIAKKYTLPIDTNAKVLFSDDAVDNAYNLAVLESDINTIAQIADKTYTVNTFDYDGIKYKRKEAKQLLEKLNIEFAALKETIQIKDYQIYNYFKSKANARGKESEFNEKYGNFENMEVHFNDRLAASTKVYEATNFISYTTPFEIIEINLDNLKPLEQNLKTHINDCLNSTLFTDNLSQEEQVCLWNYTQKDLIYFTNPNYDEDNLKIMSTALNTYHHLISLSYFTTKKKLLEFFESLE